MAKPQTKRRFTLHIHIITLFTTLILLCGLLIGFYSYIKLSQSILNSGKKIFAESSLEVKEKIANETSHIKTMLKILAASNLSATDDSQQKLLFAPQLKEMLDGTSNLNSLFIAYPNNDFFLFRKIASEHFLKTLNIPELSRYQLTMNNAGQASHRFYSQDLQLILETKDPDYQLVIKSRPWYDAAKNSNKVATTNAYIFYTSQELGLTMSRYDATTDTVIGADYNLSDLSDLLSRFKSYPSTERIVVTKKNQVIAYQDQNALLSETGKFNRLKLITEMEHPILQYAVAKYKGQGGIYEFSFAGKKWLSNISYLESIHNASLIQLVPIEELLVEAYTLRNETTLITLLIILLTLPIAWIFSKQLTSPIRKLTGELEHIKEFDFSKPVEVDTKIEEIHQLIEVTTGMKETIQHFQDLSASLIGKQSFQQLLEKIAKETISLSHGRGVIIFLAEEKKQLNIAFVQFTELNKAQNNKLKKQLQSIHYTEEEILQLSKEQQSSGKNSLLPEQILPIIAPEISYQAPLTWRLLPLTNRAGQCLGVLTVINDEEELTQQGKQNFIQAIASFSALSIEGQILLAEQKHLLESFIELIADAIDSKSPYTGGHCARVPELTKILTRAACDQQQGQYKDFDLSTEEWEELHIAAWLHDCGKIVTPEYIVDKATKLETIYDRIHEIRMRFELLKSQANSDYWENCANGVAEKLAAEQRDELLTSLDKEFEFVAECNIGSEFMSDEKITRLNKIAKRTWTRTLDDRLGIAIQEQKRYSNKSLTLPQTEQLLANKQKHLIKREHAELTEPGNPWGFKMQTPEYRYNRGELYNLSVQSGTLTDEDRFIINGHMVHTIAMLKKLPFPKNLENVPTIAGGHHEKMDGTGYPCAIPASELPLTARIMVIADVFEALTASDRPYKEWKTLSESIEIMSSMVKRNHIDADLFKLFLTSQAYLQYANQYLHREQIDQVDINKFL